MSKHPKPEYTPLQRTNWPEIMHAHNHFGPLLEAAKAVLSCTLGYKCGACGSCIGEGSKHCVDCPVLELQARLRLLNIVGPLLVACWQAIEDIRAGATDDAITRLEAATKAAGATP